MAEPLTAPAHAGAVPFPHRPRPAILRSARARRHARSSAIATDDPGAGPAPATPPDPQRDGGPPKGPGASGSLSKPVRRGRHVPPRPRQRLRELTAEADKFALNFKPDKATDYKWVVEYAKAYYAEANAHFKEFDDKAAALAQVAGGGAGLFGAGAIAALGTDAVQAGVVYACMPTVVLAAASVALSLCVRWPRAMELPPAPVWAFGQSHREGWTPGQGEARIAADVYAAGAHISEAAGLKAELLQWAYIAFASAVVALLAPLVVMLAHKSEARPNAPAPAVSAHTTPSTGGR